MVTAGPQSRPTAPAASAGDRRPRSLSVAAAPLRRAAVVGVAFALLLAACGGASEPTANDPGGGDGGDGNLVPITVVRPNPSVVNMFNLCSAWGEGYFEEEGLDVSTEAVDGVSPVLQALIAGRAEIGVPAAGPVLLARGQASGPDEEPVMFYNHFAQSTYGLVVPEDSDYQEPADLVGTTVGVGTADGAEVFFVQSILADAGLEEGTDYEILAVGDGGPALAAFERGDIDSYAAAVPDMSTLNSQGLPVREITPDEFLAYFGIGFGATQSYIDDNPEIIEAFARALVRGTEFGLANKETALAHCAELNPEEGANTEAATALFDIVAERLRSVDGGPWGVFSPDAWEAWEAALIETGDLEGPVEDLHEAYTNDFAEAANED